MRQGVDRVSAISDVRGMSFSLMSDKNESYLLSVNAPAMLSKAPLSPPYFLWFLIPKICTILIKMFKKSNSKLILSLTTSFFTIPALAIRA